MFDSEHGKWELRLLASGRSCARDEWRLCRAIARTPFGMASMYCAWRKDSNVAGEVGGKGRPLPSSVPSLPSLPLSAGQGGGRGTGLGACTGRSLSE